MRIMVLGDTHGNTPWIRGYVYPVAVCLGVNIIVQVGDFGLWEHDPSGIRFLDEVEEVACNTAIPMYALHGNHDKHSLTLEKYADRRDKQGFIPMRSWVNYIPQGHIWEWEGRKMRAFGGAYSVDKRWRLDAERKKYRQLQAKEEGRRLAGKPAQFVPSQAGTLWFPEEEMTDAEINALLAEDSSPMDFVFSHDKPRSSNPGWNRKDIAECWPNQDRLQKALLAHTPRFWFHGHLHHQYMQTIRSGDDKSTTVVGLSCDDQASEFGWRPTHCFAVIDFVDDGPDRVFMGDDPELDINYDQLIEVKNDLL